jgi:hypothetical protein
MSATHEKRAIGQRRLFLRVASAFLVLTCSRASRAQDDQVQHRPPGFQAPGNDSLETEVLARLSQTGQYQPDDLPRLARLAVLESISMLVNVRADLPNSVAGNQLEEELTALWNDSQAFYEFVSTAPSDDAASVARAGALLAVVDAGYRQIQGSLGALPGLSDRAADDMKSLSRLLGDVDSIMGTLESNAANQALPAQQPPARSDTLRGEAQIAANLVVALIGKVAEAGRGRPGRDALITDLTDMLDRLQGFCRLLSLDPPFAEIQADFRENRRQLWRTESRLVHLEWRAGLEPSWRLVRERMNGISDALGLPRVIVPAPSPRPLAAADRTVAAHVDHAVAWLDEFLSQNAASLRKTAAGAQFQTDATRLRHSLLELRRRALASVPTDQLAGSVHEIVRLNENLSERAAQLPRDTAGARSTALFKDTAAAVRKLGTVIAKR